MQKMKIKNTSDEVTLKFKLLNEDAQMPEYAHEGDAGMDVRNCEEFSIAGGEGPILVHTGLAVEIPEGYELQVRPRSGLALKCGITVLNSPGTIDSNYRGEIGVILVCHKGADFIYHFEKGERIAQLVLAKVERARSVEVKELGDTARGEGGFGSSGTK